MSQTRVAFLFGAGAEGEGNYYIENGFDYLKSSLYPDIYCEGALEALGKYFKGKIKAGNAYFNNTYQYQKYIFDVKQIILSNLVLTKCNSRPEFFVKYQSIIRCILTKDQQKVLFDEIPELEEIESSLVDCSATTANGGEEIYDKNELVSVCKNILIGECKKIFDIDEKYRPFFSELLSASATPLEYGNDASIDMNRGLGGKLDASFHTIISPRRYGTAAFSRIFNYYWCCYFTILRSIILYYADDPYLKEFLLHNKSACNKGMQLNYDKVLEELCPLTQHLSGMDLRDQSGKAYWGAKNSDGSPIICNKTYYQRIVKYLKVNTDIQCVGIATTNYYRFCSIIDDPIYLNGCLNCFEYPEYLEVSDFSRDAIQKDRLFFPFIFGQSLVKPIVHSKQIDPLYQFSQLLFGGNGSDGNNGSDVLVILGYNINEDDNHLNSFLHEFMMKDKKRLIVVGDAQEDDIIQKLRGVYCPSNISTISYRDKSVEEVIKKVFETI